MKPGLVSAAALAACLILSSPAQACGLALALALDVSGSVDPQEFALQRDGLAAALRDPSVSDALVAVKAAILVVQWTGSTRQAVVIPWRRIGSRDALAALAVEVERMPRLWRHFSTGIGEALIFTSGTFAEVGDCARKVIDVSGDGRSNEGIAPQDVRRSLMRLGFTINGLAIEGSEPDLTGYYRDSVIAGPGAFVIAATGFRDYPEKIRRKLLTEVTEPVSHLPDAGALQPAALQR
ncbi:MAG: DUF1194 domain-containing protein [Alphaproteobacteria bacterium]|nr:MAG: DUF1194 domain-containing protein [Alphaproteobacteria bacterium]